MAQDVTDPRASALARAARRRELMLLPPKRRLDALLEPKNARALVRSLPATDLYTTVHDLGLADATELIQLASPAQFQTFVDLGGWTKDRLDEHAALTWLRAARGEEPEEFLAKLAKLDLEVLELILHRLVVVHDLEEDPDVDPPGVTMETPEGRYLVEFKAEGPELAALRALVSDLIAQDPFTAVRLLEAVRWEVPTEMEEAAFRFRSARLADQGFPALEDALGIFAYTDPAKAAVRGNALGVALSRDGQRVDLLGEALRGLEDDERDALETELRLLANQALVAEGADPGDVDAQRETLELVRDVLQLGLEQATGGDPERAADVVREEHLKQIFQLGFSLTLQLKFRADRLMKRPLARIGEVVLLMPWEARVVEALRRRRPRRALKVEGAEPVIFRSRRELAECSQVLDRAEAQVDLFTALLGDPTSAQAAGLEELSRSSRPLEAATVWTALLAHALLEGVARPAPLLPGAVATLLGKALDGAGRPQPQAAAALVALVGKRVPASAHAELARLVEAELARWAEELGAPFASGQSLDAVVAEVLPLASVQ